MGPNSLIWNNSVQVDGDWPEDWSEIQKVIAIVRFWHTYPPEVRESVILEKCGEPFSSYDGIVGGVLQGLEKLDPKKLATELVLLKKKGK